METTVSLPEHLHAALLPLINIDLLPKLTVSELQKYVQKSYESSSKEIPYEVLRRVSRWTQTDEGRAVLLSKGLDYRDYSMIALLAGGKTSPSAKLGPYKRPPSPESEALQRSKDRKALSALINGMLSVIGVGVAAWWAAGSVGWTPEYKALLAVFAAFFVAATEAALYWIWTWRYNNALNQQSRHRKEPGRASLDKTDKDVSDTLSLDANSDQVHQTDAGVRRRGRGQTRENHD